MSVLDRDFEILMDDYERVLALESIGASIYNPAMKSIIKRWDIESIVVGREGVQDGENRTTAFYDRTHHDKIKKVSQELLSRMGHWMGLRADEITKKISDVTSKHAALVMEQNRLNRLITNTEEFADGDIEPASWMSKVAVEDKIDFDACIKWAKNPSVLDDSIESYTLFTSIKDGVSKREKGTFDFKKLGKSSTWAAKRASGILGFSPFNAGAEAWSLPGNVILVSRKGSTDFAVARDIEDKLNPIDRLSKDEVEKAMTAVTDILEHLETREAKRGVFSYSGIYEKVEELKKAKEGEVDRKALIEVTKRIKVALTVEDAITTSLVRTAEGLMKYIRKSIK